MGALQKVLTSDWGQVRIGEKTYPVRLVVTVAGATLWLGLMLVETGNGGMVAIWTNLLFLVPLVAVGSATRTITIRQLVSLCFIGGFMMGIARFVIHVVMPTTSVRAFLVPPLEESFKIAPVLFLLWRWRRSRLWTLAATDVLLMAAASGTGFGLVEDAYIRHRFGWPAQIDWLPVTEITGGRIIAGHGIWTALAGMTIALALLLRSRRSLVLPLGASGFALSIFDHVSNNFGVGNRDLFARFMNGIGAHGYLVLYVFFIGLLVVLAADLYTVQVALPGLPELKAPSRLPDFRARWTFSVQKRALAHAMFNYRHSSGLARAEAICMAALLDAWFHNVHFLYEQAPTPSTAAAA